MKTIKLKLKHICLLYKSSAYELYFLNRKSSLYGKTRRLSKAQLNRFKKTHAEHYKTLAHIENVLKENRIKYKKYRRGRAINFSNYDLVITVGGDGTFLEAARSLKKQAILGVNSDPAWSVGKFCTANKKTFVKTVQKAFKGTEKIKLHGRMRIELNKKAPINVLNDILVCHQNPGAMSRYAITIGGKREEQRSSGLWVSTAAGSSGAIKSAGGQVTIKDTRALHYKPRELYHSHNVKYHCRGGSVEYRRHFKVSSLMREGAVYVDGAHFQLPFNMGDELRISHSPDFLKVVS